MNTCESRRHHPNYYKMYMLNQHTNLSVILEWQRQFQMVSHKNYNLNVNEDFVILFDLQVDYMLHWWFHFRNEIPMNCLFTNWKCTYILDFKPWRWSALNMGFVVKRPSRLQGQCFFEVGRGRQQFSVGFRNFLGGLPQPGSDIPESLCGGVYYPPNKRDPII